MRFRDIMYNLFENSNDPNAHAWLHDQLEVANICLIKGFYSQLIEILEPLITSGFLGTLAGRKARSVYSNILAFAYKQTGKSDQALKILGNSLKYHPVCLRTEYTIVSILEENNPYAGYLSLKALRRHEVDLLKGERGWFQLQAFHYNAAFWQLRQQRFFEALYHCEKSLKISEKLGYDIAIEELFKLHRQIHFNLR